MGRLTLVTGDITEQPDIDVLDGYQRVDRIFHGILRTSLFTCRRPGADGVPPVDAAMLSTPDDIERKNFRGKGSRGRFLVSCRFRGQ